MAGEFFGRYLADFAYTYVTYYAGLASAMIALVFLYLVASIFIPVELGLFASLSPPEANLTGISIFNTELTAKRLALLRDLLPTATLSGIPCVCSRNRITNPNLPCQF